MPLPEDEIWRPMWLFNVMLLAFANARQAGACSTYEVLDWVGAGQRSPAISFHFFALTL